MISCPPEPAPRVSAIVEVAVRPEVFRVIDRSPEVVRPVRVDWTVGLLRGKGGARQVAIEQTRHELVTEDGERCRETDDHFPLRMVGGPHNGIGRNLRLIDWRHRPRAPWQAG